MCALGSLANKNACMRSWRSFSVVTCCCASASLNVLEQQAQAGGRGATAARGPHTMAFGQRAGQTGGQSPLLPPAICRLKASKYGQCLRLQPTALSSAVGLSPVCVGGLVLPWREELLLGASVRIGKNTLSPAQGGRGGGTRGTTSVEQSSAEMARNVKREQRGGVGWGWAHGAAAGIVGGGARDGGGGSSRACAAAPLAACGLKSGL